MFRKIFISLVATATLGAGSIGMTSAADANVAITVTTLASSALTSFPFLWLSRPWLSRRITMTTMLTKTADTAG